MDDKTSKALESLNQLWDDSSKSVENGYDDMLSRLIEDDEDYIDEYFNPDEFE